MCFAGSITCWGSNQYAQCNVASAVYTQLSLGALTSCAVTPSKTVVCWGDNGEASPPSGTVFLAACGVGTAGLGGTCSACAAGTQALVGQEACAPCAAGTYGGGASPFCAPCSGGSYSASGSSSSGACTPCPTGRYGAAGGGSAACTACPALSYGPSAGATVCHLCPAGTTSWEGAASCTPCAAWTGTVACVRGAALSALASGDVHACALTASGSPICWGDNMYSQSSPTPSASFVSIVVGTTFSAGLDASGSAWFWGYVPTISSGFPYLFATVTQAPLTQLSAGPGYACAVTINGAIVCIGCGAALAAAGGGWGPPGRCLMSTRRAQVQRQQPRDAAHRQHAVYVRFVRR